MTRRDPMLASHERHERQEMASTVTFRRGAAETVTTNGDVTQTGTVVYTGRATIARRDTGSRKLTYGGAARSVFAYQVSVPRGTGLVKGDVCTVGTSTDPNLTGKMLRVTDDSGSDWSSSRVVECEVVA